MRRDLMSVWVVNRLSPERGPGQIVRVDGDYISIEFEGHARAEYTLSDLGPCLVKAETREAAGALCTELTALSRAERERLVDEFATAARREQRAGAVRRVLQERGVTRLVHFTRLGNLASIAADGGLRSRGSLEREGRSFLACDDSRHDGSEHVNLSIEFPNYRMFFPKRQELDTDERNWVVLVLDALLLEELECVFVMTNAASRSINTRRWKHLTTARALRLLFREAVRLKDGELVTRAALGIPDRYPSDPQSEVLVRTDVSLDYLAYVAVCNSSVLQDARFPRSLVPRARVDSRLFGPREDYRVWSKKSESDADDGLDSIPFELL